MSMRCFLVSPLARTAGFEFDRDFDSYAALEETDPERFAALDIEAFEYRKDIDGTEMPQYGVTVAFQSLVVELSFAQRVRDYLAQHEGAFAECRITTQYGTYVGFKPFSLYEDVPDAPFFRIRKSPQEPTMWLETLYSEAFAGWIADHLPTDGLRIVPVTRDEKFQVLE
ncbi:hypothetical protein [Corynebacterium cystitidis]|uniref:hypothetical protein n=1 Tax=Corynebacterium cystitidis TaxID=35757 RepID=UPI00211EF849|nr:hypothetical protein [Corynebacterium cystitidis]